jgi:peptide/nickel transport system substrate-binding protein
VDGPAIVIEAGADHAAVPRLLTDVHSAVVVRGLSDTPIGTGPFRIDRAKADAIVFQAHEAYWDGRPFLDAVEIRPSRTLDEERADLEAGRADVITIEPTDARTLAQRQFTIARSPSRDLVALTFEAHLTGAADAAFRRTVASTIDRPSITRVVLQGDGEPAEALLPSSISGYAPSVLTKSSAPLSRAAIAALPPTRRTLALRIDPGDSMMLAIAQRIAVNARDAGIIVTIQAQAGIGPRPDLRMIRLPIEQTTRGRALDALMTAIGPRMMQQIGRVPPPAPAADAEETAAIEQSLLGNDIVVPVAFIPEMYALAPRVRSWMGPLLHLSGGWNIADGWLDTVPVAP